MKQGILAGIAVLTLALTALIGCSDKGPDDPREVVMKFFGAMEKNDQAAIAHMLDLVAIMEESDQDYALTGGENRVFTNPQDILDDLTEGGKTKERWFSLQRIVNTAEVYDETAVVEVTFVDKDASRGYRTNFGLRKINGRWKIYSFQTQQEAPGGDQ